MQTLAWTLVACASYGVVASGTQDVDPCTWTDPKSGTYFDLRPMTESASASNQGWVVNGKRPGETFYTQICAPVKATCQGSQSKGIPVATQFTGNVCESVIGVLPDPKKPPEYSLIDPAKPEMGVQVKFVGGDMCENKAREVTIKVACDAGYETAAVSGVESETCSYILEFRGRDGCPGGASANDGMSGGWVFVIIVACGMAVYCGCGTLYNAKYKNLRGINAIPNKEFWVNLPDLIKAGCQLTFNKTKDWKAKLTGGASSSEYANDDYDGIDDANM